MWHSDHVSHASAPGADDGMGLARAGLQGVAHAVAVASGKGGVGKSTTAANLAVSLALTHRLRVGLMDADVFGPSVPRLMHLEGKPYATADKKMVPLENFGVKCISMGFLLDQGEAAVWRGPMVMGAIDKLLKGCEWGELDVLVIDMPPGTGDAYISVSQKIKLSGAVIVSTPQEMSLSVARRGITMYGKVQVPVLGLVENMSYFTCKCGESHDIFGSGGAERVAQELGLDLLGKVPLEAKLRQGGDAGVPVLVGHPQSESARAYDSIAKNLMAKLEGNKPTS